MNENIDLTKILKDCPEGTELWSDNYGTVKFVNVGTEWDTPIKVELNNGHIAHYTEEGWWNKQFPANCLLWPSKDCRDWSKFTAPWYHGGLTTEKKSDKNNVHYYVARDKGGILWLYMGKPVRRTAVFDSRSYGKLITYADKFSNYGLNVRDFDNLKWEEEPVEVFINLED